MKNDDNENLSHNLPSTTTINQNETFFVSTYHMPCAFWWDGRWLMVDEMIDCEMVVDGRWDGKWW